MAKENKKYYTRTITLPNGKRKYVYGKTAREADEKLAEIKAEIEGGLVVDDDTTFGEVAKVWIEQYKAPFLRESSLRIIKEQVNRYLMPRFATIQVRKITPLMVQNFAADLVKLRLVTGRRIFGHFSAILTVAMELGCIKQTPISQNVAAAIRKASHSTTEEKDVMDAAVENYLMSKLQPLSREHLFFSIGRDTGMRKAEIIALNWDCIDLEGDVIDVRRNTTWDVKGCATVTDQMKTETSKRKVPITAYLHGVLQALAGLKTPQGFLFESPTDPGRVLTASNFETMWEHIRNLAKDIDPEFAANFTSHVLRHTYITRLFNAGKDIKLVQYLAGHTSVSTTLGIYTHFTESQHENAFQTVREVFASETNKVINFPGAQKKAE